MSGPLAPGARIGILGAGQLGRMLALAAGGLGFDVHVFADEAGSVAGRVAAREVVGDLADLGAVAEFARGVDVVTYEFENVPVAAAEAAAALVPVRPTPRALAVAQDRLSEKRFFTELSARTAPHAAVDDLSGLEAALAAIGAPAILKTRREGYDGKGQVRLERPADAPDAFARLAGRPLILEGFCPFEREVSVIAARGLSGEIAVYPLAENTHEGGVLRLSRAPAALAPDSAAAAQAITASALEALDYVGVLAIEFFVMPDGGLIVNEMAPRVHNSGHWTEDACLTSQFAQHIRAIAGWPLGPTTQHSAAEMWNLLGADATQWRRWVDDPTVRLRLYGKRDIAPGRKMGHATRVSPL